MTAQISDQLDNQHGAVDFGELELYGIITGDINANYGWGISTLFKTRLCFPMATAPARPFGGDTSPNSH